RGAAARRVALRIRTFVPAEAEPAQLGELPLREPGPFTRAVEVLDPQGEHPARVLRPQPREDRRARVAEVQLAGRAGRESTARNARRRPHAVARESIPGHCDYDMTPRPSRDQ